MATTSIPAPNALMLKGDSNALAMHGRKLAAFPDWWTRWKNYSITTSGRWGDVDFSGKEEQSISWRYPVEPEPVIEKFSNKQIREITLPPIIVIPRWQYGRDSYEPDSEFLPFVRTCEGIYGVEFKIDENKGGGAVAELPSNGNRVSENVLPGYLVAVWDLSNADKEDSLAQNAKAILGGSQYALAVAIKKAKSRFFKSKDGAWLDIYRSGYYSLGAGEENCEVCGWAIYDKDGEKKSVVGIRMNMRPYVGTVYVNRNMPTVTTTEYSSTYCPIGWQDESWEGKGWDAPEGVLATVQGSPIVETMQ